MSSKFKCRGCKAYFPKPAVTINGGTFHTLDCAITYAQATSKKLRVKADKDKANKEKKAHSLAKKNLRESSKKWMMKKTKDVCHKYIRTRDKEDACISCGRYESEIDSTGWDHIWDAGHFLSRGSHPELRFEELNIHKQCVKCNTAPNLSGQQRSVREGYRESLINKIGLEKVEWLEGPHPIPKRTLDDLKGLQELYKLKTKELEQ